MESKITGMLKPSEYDPDFFESEPFRIPYFENKKIRIGFVEPLHKPYLVGADKALANFLELDTTDRIKDSGKVKLYYDEILKHGYTQRLYIKDNQDIWNYATPTEIIIEWDENENFYVCVSCECKWEEEHGVYLVFENGRTLTRVGEHDGHFTDEKPESDTISVKSKTWWKFW
ncbi:DUF6985 domain-containing protein [Pedobacter frigoris]|uniref:DUF6985 domain-containing protein n=1 Tax=Pedobacter frigoris TaxID=2571272 RepID=UPI0029314FEF|nr:hypothetical protein [Pedobacter frigoris]